MPWTTEQKIDSLMRLPWTVTVEGAQDPEAPADIVVRVTELQGMVVVGTRAEVEAEFWDALRATLACYLEFGDPVPLPLGVRAYPWDAVAPRGEAFRIAYTKLGDAWDVVTLHDQTAGGGALLPA